MSTENQPEHISPYDNDPEILYTFAPIKYLESLKVGKLWFAPTRTYNDIHENTIFTRESDPSGDFALAKEAEIKINEWIDSRVVRCFTTDPTNTLMWAHYAESHKGVCVGFRLADLKNKTFKEKLRHYPIRYSSYPPLLIVGNHPKSMETYYLAQDVMLTKSIHWAYEKEHRMYTGHPELAEAGGGLLDVGVESVVDVIFGAKVDDKIVEEQRSKLPDGIQARKAEYEKRALSYNLQIRNL